MNKVVIIDYGAGNVQSVKFALERLGIQAELTASAELIQTADKVIFPGVGEARSAMREVSKAGLDKVIPSLKQPVLGICLGMQLMCSFSEERDTECLGIYDEKVVKFQTDYKVPHMGWNSVDMKSSELLQGLENDSSFYFVHSFYMPENEYTIGYTFHDQGFSAIVEKNNFYGCQFHPEKSGKNGAHILENFLNL